MICLPALSVSRFLARRETTGCGFHHLLRDLISGCRPTSCLPQAVPGPARQSRILTRAVTFRDFTIWARRDRKVIDESHPLIQAQQPARYRQQDDHRRRLPCRHQSDQRRQRSAYHFRDVRGRGHQREPDLEQRANAVLLHPEVPEFILEHLSGQRSGNDSALGGFLHNGQFHGHQRADALLSGGSHHTAAAMNCGKLTDLRFTQWPVCLARNVPRHAIRIVSFALGVNRRRNAATVFDAHWEFHFRALGFGGFLRRSCVKTSRILNLLRKIGCPTWIRTMNNASKGRCVTITPSDKPRLS